MLSAIPLGWFRPFRQGAVAFPRGTLPRKICIAVLKAAKGDRRIGTTLDEVRPLDATDISFSPVDSMVMDAVYWFGVQGYEGKMSDVWTSLCGRSQSILEVGGNVGLFSVIGGRKAPGRYTVVEPVPANASVLRGNLLRNGLAGVEVLEAAVIAGDEPCDVHLSIPAEGRDAPVGAHLLSNGIEVSGRRSEAVVTVRGIPFGTLALGRDLIKIDAEGIEAELLASIRPMIARDKPTLVIEVLPEAARLGTLLADMAREIGYRINVVPAYGTDTVVTVPPAEFSADVPRRHNSKDVVLSVAPI